MSEVPLYTLHQAIAPRLAEEADIWVGNSVGNSDAVGNSDVW